MLKEKSRELATYMLCGVTKSGIMKLFYAELFLCGIFSLVCGVMIGILIFELLGSTVSVSVIFQSIIYYLAALIASIIITTVSMRKLEIKDLLSHKKQNETRKTTVRGVIFSGAVTIVSYVLLMIILANFSVATVSFIAPIVGMMIYFFYRTVFDGLNFYRINRGKTLFENNRLVVIGQMLSNVKTNTQLCTIIACCLLTAIIAGTSGVIFTSGKAEILGGNADTAMGFVQIYIAILFTVIILTIVSIREILENREYKQNRVILTRLGMDRKTLNRTYFMQIIISFTLPVAAAFLTAVGAVIILEKSLSPVFGAGLLTKGILIYTAIFVVIYVAYIVVTYRSVKKNNIQ
jgi:ABC-type antimicrobial peptide transport system permease subunit